MKRGFLYNKWYLFRKCTNFYAFLLISNLRYVTSLPVPMHTSLLGRQTGSVDTFSTLQPVIYWMQTENRLAPPNQAFNFCAATCHYTFYQQ